MGFRAKLIRKDGSFSFAETGQAWEHAAVQEARRMMAEDEDIAEVELYREDKKRLTVFR